MRPTPIVLFLCATLETASAQECHAVARAQCGTDYTNNCLKCGSGSKFDCEECCPGCTQTTKGDYKYCTCSPSPSPPSPSPPSPSPPSPSPPGKGDYLCKEGQCYDAPGYGTETKAQCDATCKGPKPASGNFTNYQVAGMDVLALTGAGPTEKVVVMLHGGGGSGSDWRYQYDAGWLGNTSGIKYVWPTSPDHLWYGSTKQAGCGLCDECAYTAGSIETAATRVATLIEHEKVYVDGDAKRLYLAGFSEGGQMTAYMQIAKLDFALGGTIIMDGYPLPPVCDAKTVKSKATYTGADMNWFIYWGGADPIFPAQESLAAYHGMFEALSLPNSTLAFEYTEPGMGHSLSQNEFVVFVKFIREGENASTSRSGSA